MSQKDFMKCCVFINKEFPAMIDIFMCCDFKDAVFTQKLLTKIDNWK